LCLSAGDLPPPRSKFNSQATRGWRACGGRPNLANMHAFAALTLACLRDILRRPSTILLGAAGAALILSLRWFSAFGLGYEVVQLLELGAYTIGLLGAVAAILFWLPDEDDNGSDLQLMARPISPWALSGAALLGRVLVFTLLALLWTLCIAAALWWFRLEDPRLFGYRGETSVLAASSRVIGPVCGQVLATAVLLALVQPLARTRSAGVVAVSVLGVYGLGYLSGSLGLVGRLAPDLALLDFTGGLWGHGSEGMWLWPVLHACLWCVAGVGLDAGLVRLKLRS
jgi:hypothetical protein